VSALGDAPPAFVDKVRGICSTLPDAYEEPAWVGTRWRIRKRTIAHVFTIDSESGPRPAVMFRSTGPELDALRGMGDPYVTGWKNAAMLYLGGDTDWTEVTELLTESYCFLAPKKLVANVQRPDAQLAD
jgi:hypothetical protein